MLEDDTNEFDEWGTLTKDASQSRLDTRFCKVIILTHVDTELTPD